MRKQIKIQACSSPSIEDALILFPSYTLEVMEPHAIMKVISWNCVFRNLQNNVKTLYIVVYNSTKYHMLTIGIKWGMIIQREWSADKEGGGSISMRRKEELRHG